MKKVIAFLRELQVNNNRDWFEKHRSEYKEALDIFNNFTIQLIEEVGKFDSDIALLSLKDCTYRIYRDVRFSPNKEPYKNHMGAYMCRGGKKSGYGGYYFHLEPGLAGEVPQFFLTSGIYMPEPRVLRSIRDEILDNGEEIDKAVREAKGFTLDTSNALKKTPKGFPAETPFDHYLKLKDFYVSKMVGEDYITHPKLAQRAAKDYQKTKKLLDILNRAAQFAYEEM